jgi:hypothetical protein
MQDGGLHIMNVHGIFGDIPGELVCGANDVSLLDSPTGHPPTECLAKVIPAIRFVGIPLPKGCAPKLSTPYHERVFEHPTLF